jgi:hypothetical protein
LAESRAHQYAGQGAGADLELLGLLLQGGMVCVVEADGDRSGHGPIVPSPAMQNDAYRIGSCFRPSGSGSLTEVLAGAEHARKTPRLGSAFQENDAEGLRHARAHKRFSSIRPVHHWNDGDAPDQAVEDRDETRWAPE